MDEIPLVEDEIPLVREGVPRIDVNLKPGDNRIIRILTADSSAF